MECIICRDSGIEPLIDNTYCGCKYKCHNGCWIDYVHSQKTVKCLMCRKPIISKKHDNTHNLTSTHPYTSSTQRHSIHNSIHEGQYHEFPDTSPVSHRSAEQVSSSSVHTSCFTRIGKALLLIGLVAVVMVFVIVLL